MKTITITHSRTDGTLVDGSAKGDGVLELLRSTSSSWRYFPSLGCLGLTHSRDRRAKTWEISQAEKALTAAGWTVTLEIDDLTPGASTADREAEAKERAEDRADRYGTYSENAAGRADALRASGDRDAAYPMGQPILIGHHSEARHRRDLERARNKAFKALDESKKSTYWAGREAAAANHQAHREDIPTTLRRIDRLEADRRAKVRALEPSVTWKLQRTLGEWTARLDADGVPWKVLVTYPHGPDPDDVQIEVEVGLSYATRQRIGADLDALDDELGYWRDHVAKAEAGGLKIWSKADFVKGDYVNIGGSKWYLVLRANPKTVTVPNGINTGSLRVVTKDNVMTAIGPSTWTETVPYSSVRGRKTAAEIAELLDQPTA